MNITDPPPSPQRVSLVWLSLCSICFLGIALNSIVFIRTARGRRQSSSTRLSTRLLRAMAAADSLCLLALLLLLSTRYVGIQDERVFSVICKLDLFIIHSASAFSIWCWLVLSTVRYVAIYMPYTHLKMNKDPTQAVIAVGVLCCVCESWVLYDIGYVPQIRGCESVNDEAAMTVVLSPILILYFQLNRSLQIFEIIFSYFLPLCFIIVLDFKVMCRKGKTTRRSTGSSSTGEEEKEKEKAVEQLAAPSDSLVFSYATSAALFPANRLIGTACAGGAYQEATLKRIRSRRRAQQWRMLKRALLITFFDLMMNLPSHLWRMYLNLASAESLAEMNPDWVMVIELVSQVCYFAQFSLNAVYLVCMVYEPAKRCPKIPAHSLSSALSPRMSVRQPSPNPSSARALLE